MLIFKKNGTRTALKNDGLHISTNENQSSKKKSNSEIVDEVLNNEWGIGADRYYRLTKAGYDYDTIQDMVNDRLYRIAYEVIAGKWGYGFERSRNLIAANYDPVEIQYIIDDMLKVKTC